MQKTIILTWDPVQTNTDEKGFNKGIKHLLSHREGEGLLYRCSSDLKLDAVEGDRFYVVRTGVDPKGIVMAGEISSNVFDTEDNDGNKMIAIELHPSVIINAKRTPIITVETLKDEIPTFDWDNVASGTPLKAKESKAIDDLWISYMTNNYERFSTRDKKVERVPAAAFGGDNAAFLSDDGTLYHRLYDRYEHRCDLCGIDYDFVYEKLPTVPRMSYFVRRHISPSKGGKEIRSVKCLCRNCTTMLNIYGWEELSEKVKMMRHDDNNVMMSINIHHSQTVS